MGCPEGRPLFFKGTLYGSIVLPIIIFFLGSLWLFNRGRAFGLSKKQAFLIAFFHFLMLPLMVFSFIKYQSYKRIKNEALIRQKNIEISERIKKNIQIFLLSYEIEPGILISDKESFFFDTLKVKAEVMLKNGPSFEGESAKLIIQDRQGHLIDTALGYTALANAKTNFNTYRKSTEKDQQFQQIPEENLFLLPEGEYEILVLCEYCLKRPAKQIFPELDQIVRSYNLALFVKSRPLVVPPLISIPLSDFKD